MARGDGRRNLTPNAEEIEQGRALAWWRSRYPEAYGFELEWDEELGLPVPDTRREKTVFCGARIGRTGRTCFISAGAGTAHGGVGACFRHDSPVERAAGAWMVIHRISQVMEISPWDALLLAVKRAAAWAAFYDSKLAEVEDDDELLPGRGSYEWVRAAERVNDKLARWSKMAVDAGVAQLMVQQARIEGETIARVMNSAIGEAGLGEQAEARLRAALRVALETLDESVRPPAALDGSVLNGEEVPLPDEEPG